MAAAKNRRMCCSNIGPARVLLPGSLSLLVCALLVLVAIMANSLDKKMQVQAFVVAPLVGLQTNHHHQQKSSSSSSSFGRCLPTEAHCNKEDEDNDGLEKAASASMMMMMSRRSLITATSAILLACSPMLAAEAAMENTQTTFKVGEAISVDAAKARLVEARESLQYLVDNYDDIVQKGGGDNVRRYLGTVGTSSGLYGISKVLKTLQEEAEDIVEYTELCNDFEQALRDADTACYSAIFVEFSAAKTKPEKFFADAKGDVARMQKYLKDLTAELSL